MTLYHVIVLYFILQYTFLYYFTLSIVDSSCRSLAHFLKLLNSFAESSKKVCIQVPRSHAACVGVAMSSEAERENTYIKAQTAVTDHPKQSQNEKAVECMRFSANRSSKGLPGLHDDIGCPVT